MKKLLVILISLFCLTGCSNKYIIKINYSEFKEKIENQDTFILEVVKTGCPACKKFSPRLGKIVKKNRIKVYQLNYSKLSDKQIKEFDNDFSISYTPTIIFITNGKETSVLNRLVGAVEEEKIVERFKDMEYIK